MHARMRLSQSAACRGHNQRYDAPAARTVLYPYEADTPFDADYYHASHIPLARELWGEALTGVSVVHTLAGVSGEPMLSTIALFEFASMEAFQAAMAHPRAGELQADVPNFTRTTPQVQLGRTVR